jgi:hypothetical protein
MASLTIFQPETPVALKSLAEVAQALLQYHEPPFSVGAPEGLDPTWLAADAEMAHAIACERCGHEGGAYAAFHLGATYVAYAVCPFCSHATEL